MSQSILACKHKLAFTHISIFICLFLILKRGEPIPFNKLPPQDAMKYYTDPNNRGYLADPGKIDDARFALAQKYG